MGSLFLVWSYNVKDKGQEYDFKKWLIEEFQPYLKKIPFFKSVRTYMRRIGLGQEPIWRTWIEISDFSVLDKWVTHVNTKEWVEIGKTFFSLTEDFNSTIVYELK